MNNNGVNVHVIFGWRLIYSNMIIKLYSSCCASQKLVCFLNYIIQPENIPSIFVADE